MMVMVVAVVMAMMVVMVFMVMTMVVVMVVALFLAFDQNVNVSASDPALSRLLRRNRDPRDRKLRYFLCETLRRNFQQRAHEHIPGRAHITFYIQCFHLLSSMWFIMLAR